MLKKTAALSLLMVFTAISGKSQQPPASPQSAHSHVVPLKPFSGDHRFEAVSGDVKKAGEIYVIRIHSEAGYVVMPHTHPEDEHIVVVVGSWALGTGDRFDPDKLETMDVGTYGLVGKKMAHFARSRTAAIVQVHGIERLVGREAEVVDLSVGDALDGHLDIRGHARRLLVLHLGDDADVVVVADGVSLAKVDD